MRPQSLNTFSDGTRMHSRRSNTAKMPRSSARAGVSVTAPARNSCMTTALMKVTGALPYRKPSKAASLSGWRTAPMERLVSGTKLRVINHGIAHLHGPIAAQYRRGRRRSRRSDVCLMSGMTYDRAQIAEWLGAPTVVTGQADLRTAFQVSWTGNLLRGSVQGSQRKPTTVTANIEADEFDGQWTDGNCSCPVGHNCKHVAAVLLASLGLAAPIPAGVRSEVPQGREGFRYGSGSRPGRPANRPSSARLALAMSRDQGFSLQRDSARRDRRHGARDSAALIVQLNKDPLLAQRRCRTMSTASREPLVERLSTRVQASRGQQ